MSLTAILAAEWTKLRTLRSTFWTLLLTAVLSVGLGYLVSLSIRSGFADASPEMRDQYPLFASFYSLTLGQLALVWFGVLAVGGEYGSGTIRASLAAVPGRGRFYAGKVLATALPALGISLVTVVATVATAQATLGPYRSLDGAGQAILGACLYLVLICLFALGVAAMLRSSVAALGVLIPVFFLGSQGLGNIPRVKTVTQYLPDQAGQVIMHIVPADDPVFGRGYGPWTGLGITALWTGLALLGGYLALRHRDA